MKTNLFLCLALISILSVGSTNAQVSNYTFTQTISNYGLPSTGTLVGMMLQDDDATLVNLPFTFTFNGTPHNTVYVCSNGFLSFGNANGSEVNPLSQSSTKNIISAFGQDLVMGIGTTCDITTGSNTLTNCGSVNGFSVGDIIFDYASDFGNVNPTITAIAFPSVVVNVNATSTISQYDLADISGYIKQAVIGAAPNRICEFEFSKFCRYVYDEYVNFKIRLYETSNKVEILYGDFMAGFDSTPSEVGLKGNSTNDFNSREVTLPNPWNTSNAASSVSDVCDFDINFYPSTGLSYMWSPACVFPTMTLSLSQYSICPGGSATLSVNGAETYSWSTGSTSPQIVVTPSATTGYTVFGTNSPTCQASYSLVLHVSPCTGINSIAANSIDFGIYPNPFISDFVVNNRNDNDLQIVISDALGKKVYESKVKGGSQKTIELAELNSGFYFITLSHKNSSLTRKIIKE